MLLPAIAREHILPLVAIVTVFVTMITLGLLVESEALAVSLRRRILPTALLLAVVVPVPALAVMDVKALDLRGPVAAGIILMAISPSRLCEAARELRCP